MGINPKGINYSELVPLLRQKDFAIEEE